MKKVLCTLLSVVMLLSVSVTAFAAENVIPSMEISNDAYTSPAIYDDYLNAHARSTSVPKNYYDLSASNYNASLEVVSAHSSRSAGSTASRKYRQSSE